METRANTVVVGLFMLVALFSSFAFVYWFGTYGDERELRKLDVRIEGAVSGLVQGSIVQFNGITVGRVTGLQYDREDPRYVTVNTLVESDVPLRVDTRASIGSRGLSGGAFIQLEGGTPAAPVLLQEDATGERTVRLDGDPSAVADLIEQVGSVAVRAERIVADLEQFVAVNNQVISDTLENTRTFSAALASNSDNLSAFLDSAGDVAVSLQSLSGKLDGAVAQAEGILTAVDTAAISSSVADVSQFTAALAGQRVQIQTLIGQAAQAVTDVQGATARIEPIIARVQTTVEAIEPEQVAQTIANLNTATARANDVLAVVDAQSVGRTLANIENATGQIAAVGEKAQSVLSAVDSATVQTLIADLGNASRSASSVLAAVEPQQVASAIANVDAATARANEVLAVVDAQAVGRTVANIEQASSAIVSAGSQAEAVMSAIDAGTVQALVADVRVATRNVGTLLAAVDAERVNTAVADISTAAKSASQVADDARNIVADVRKVTEPLGARAGDIDRVVQDALQLAGRLNEASKKIDGLLTQAGSLLGTGSGDGGLAADAQATLAEFRQTARTFTANLSTITGSVSKLADRGLADTPGLIRSAQQSLDRLDRVIRNLQDNPSSLITGSGGSRVRETRPRR